MGNCLSRPCSAFPVCSGRIHPADTSESVDLSASGAHMRDASVHPFLATQREGSSIPPSYLSNPTHNEGNSTRAHKEGSFTSPTLSSSPRREVEPDGSSCLSISVTPTCKENNQILGPTHGQSQHTNIENKEYKAMVTFHNQLITAIATDYLNIAGILLAEGFISDEISAKMLLPYSTPNEKATILIIAVRDKIKLAPHLFLELVKLFSEQKSTQCIVNLLQSAANQSELYLDIISITMYYD